MNRSFFQPLTPEEHERGGIILAGADVEMAVGREGNVHLRLTGEPGPGSPLIA